MAIPPSQVRAQFPADPPEWNGVDLTNMKEIHRAINRELLASGMDYTAIAKKYEYNKGSLYRVARMKTSVAYRQWLTQAGRDQSIADGQEVMETLTRVLREEGYDEHITPHGATIIKKNDTKDLLKAAELIMKSYGMLIEKKAIKTESTIVVDIEGFDDEDGEVIDV